MTAPLTGIRVLDLTRLLPGPMCTLYLADLGADVIKIEDTGAGDYARDIRPPGARADTRTMSAWYRTINRNKRSLALDLKSDAGRDAFRVLARSADVVVESFRPGIAAALGAGPAAVHAINPRLVYCSLSGYGQTGPRAAVAGHDINYLAYAGVLDQIGTRGGPPAIPGVQIADLLGGAATAAIAILAALVGAQRGAGGRFVDVAMADAMLAYQIFALGRLEDCDDVAKRGDDLLTGGVPCYGVYPTGDERWLAVGALEPKFWTSLCAALGRPDLSASGLATGDEGLRVRRELEAIFATGSLAQWTARLAGVDCCVAPVLRFDEALADAQFVSRGMIATRADGSRACAPAFRLMPAAEVAMREAPRHGEHSREILRDAGYPSDAIDALVADRVISVG
ncbi:MAG: CaiB/BaiF CoA transferase family protein [Casimicrobiaceae bacterium]